MPRYTSTPDALARIVPWFTFGMVAAGCIIALVDVWPEGIGIVISTAIIPAIVLTLIAFITRRYRITGITVDDLSITIERKAKPVVINLSDIISIQRVDNMRFAIRTFGNGGMFGYTGSFYKKGIGSMTWYCTQRKNYVLIEKSDGKKIVITPDDPEGFLKDVERDYPLLVTRQ